MSETDLRDRVNDAVNLCSVRNIPKYVGFITLAERTLIEPLVKNVKHGFFGGYEDAERTILGIFPDWYAENKEGFPLTPVTFTYRDEDKLMHKDFLGAVMALGITRKSVGDILIDNGTAVMFLHNDILNYVITQLEKVGNVGVTVKIGMPEILPGHSEMLSFCATVSSLRLDCVVCSLINKSRKIAAELIEKDFVTLNSSVAKKVTHTVKCGDIISVRTYGKYKITDNTDISKKGKIILKWKKYS